jgi:GNAT superfamily N-acetyltransferase
LTLSRIREATAADDAVVLGLMTEYMTWALAEFERTYGFTLAADPRHTGAALAAFRRPSGLIALVEADGVPAGVAALRAQGEGIVEIKRMFVRPGQRGGHLGSLLLDWLLERAREEFGAEIVRLDTNRFMERAHQLYESRGFTERPPYDGSEIPADLRHLWRFYELDRG